MPTPPITPRFAVIVVNYNGGDVLRDCVSSALAEGVPAEQIVLVDNHSHDDSVSQVQAAITGLQAIRNTCNAGFARAVNQGIRLTQSTSNPDFILLLNNDAELDPGCLGAFAQAFAEHPQAALAGGQLHYPDGRLQSAFAPLPGLAEEIVPLNILRLFAADRYARKAILTRTATIESVFGACLCVRASALPTLGLLDEDFFFFFEEIEWCHRARQLGFEVVHVPAARAQHFGGHTANRFRGPSRVEYHRAKLTYFRRTHSTSAAALVSIVMVLRTLINALSGAAACLFTLFLNRKRRMKAATYWYVLGWHLLGRPATWGLPDKCSRS